MAITYTPNDALTLVRRYLKQIPIAYVDAQVADMIYSTIYRAAFWKGTLVQISPSITLLDGIQDYSAPTQLFRLFRARISRTDTSPVESRPLDIREHLEPELTIKGGLEGILAVSHEEALGQLRLDRPPGIGTGVVYKLDGEYQVNPVKITDANLGVNTFLKDEYFDVFVEGIKWKMYQFADDPRAGGVVIDKRGNAQFTGQYAIFMAALDDMRRTEDAGLGVPVIFPAGGSFGARTASSGPWPFG